MSRNRPENKYQKGSPSQNRRYHIERNSLEEEEVVLPYWEEPSSSANYHMQEEIRLLKMKNMHFQDHMERMKLEYEELRKTIEAMDENQRELIRRNLQLSYRMNSNISKMQEMKSQIEIVKFENEDLRNDIKSASIREDDYKRKIAKLREEETILKTKISALSEEHSIMSQNLSEKNKTIEKLKHLQTTVTQINKDIESEREQTKGLKQQVLKLMVSLEEKQLNLIDIMEEDRAKYEDLLDKNHCLSAIVKKNEESIKELESQNFKLKQENQEDQKKKNQVMMIDRVQSVILTGNATVRIDPQQESMNETKNMKNGGNKNEGEEGPNYEHMIHELQLQLNELTNQNIRLTKVSKQKSGVQEKIGDLNIILQQKLVAIDQLKQSIREKDEKIQQLKNHQLTGKKQQIEEHDLKGEGNLKAEEEENKNLTDLQIEYNAELQALRRLILYKKYPNNNSQQATVEIERKVRKEEQAKLDKVVREYKSLQKELFTLQQQVLSKKCTTPVTFRNSEEEKLMYMEAIKKWEKAYEELYALYQAKLTSKDEQINLLNLRLMNYNSGYA